MSEATNRTESQSRTTPDVFPSSNGAVLAGSCGYIDDGYTEKGFIRAIPGHYPDLRFTYRPILITERAVIMDAEGKLDPEEIKTECARILASKIKSWDLKDRNGKTPELTQASLLKVKPNLFNHIWFIVSGQEPSQIDPKWTADEKNQNTKTKLAAIGSDTDVGIEREVADAKNS